MRWRPTSSETWRAASKSMVRRIGTNTCSPVLPEVLTIASSDMLSKELAQPEGDLLALLEGHRVELGLRALAPPSRSRCTDRCRTPRSRGSSGSTLRAIRARWRSRCCRDRVGPGPRARVPDVELERPDLREPQQRRQVVAQQVVVRLLLAPGEHRDASRRTPAAPVSQCFWKKRSPRMPSGMRIMVSGRSARCGSMYGRHLREIDEQVALGERRLRRAPRPRASTRDRGW